MPNYQVGNLEIAFKAIDETSADFKKLKNSLNAIQRLISNIANADISKFSANIKSITTDLSPFLTKIQEAETSLSAFATVTQSLGIKSLKIATAQLTTLAQTAEASASSVEQLGNEIDGVQVETKQLGDDGEKVISIWDKFSDKAIKSTLALEQQRQQTLRNRIAFLELNIAHNETGYSSEILQQELARLREELNNDKNATKESASGWKKFVKSIGRIALYRAIRRALQLITQSITETIQEFAKLDDNINDTVSRATSSLKVIQLSFGTAFLPLIEAITPLLSQLAQGFANFANIISQAMATGDTYWAINAQAIKDYREQLEKTTGSLASFDKISSLNQKDTFSFFEEKEIDKSNDKIRQTQNIISGIKNIILSIGKILGSVWGIAEPILGLVVEIASAVLPIVSLLAKFLSSVLTPIINAIKPIANNIIKQIAVAINGVLLSLVPVAYIIELILKQLQTIFLLAKSLLSLDFSNFPSEFNNIWTNWASDDFARGSWGNLVSSGIRLAQDFGYDSDVVSRANSGSRGIGSVPYTSVSQSSGGDMRSTEQAMYNALVRYGRENRGSDNAININIDGQRIFEAVQRTANKKGLGFSRV